MDKTPPVRITSILLGSLIFCYALFGDVLGIGWGYPGFGVGNAILLVTGVSFVVLGFCGQCNEAVKLLRRVFLSRCGLAAFGVLVALLVAELVLRRMEATTADARHEDFAVCNALMTPIKDPQLGWRLPAYAPGHDFRGFRNQGNVRHADIVAIGDSQTWGMNARRSAAWPQVLAELSGHTVYNMALGYYGPVQYWVLLKEALELSPQIVVVGLYFGNDIYDAYAAAYSNTNHADLRMAGDTNLLWDAVKPRVERLTEEKQEYRDSVERPHASGFVQWVECRSAVLRLFARSGIGSWGGRQSDVEFEAAKQWATACPEHGLVYERDKLRTVFTTAYRSLALDLEEPRISHGLRITKEMVSRIQHETDEAGIHLLILLIPTKESAFLDKMQEISSSNDMTYSRLVEMEGTVRSEIIAHCQSRGIEYQDALPALRRAIEEGQQVYPETTDGHPTPAGYRILANVVLEGLRAMGWSGN